jgi:hypothetical protein
MPDTASEWDRRLDGSIKAAQEEADRAGNRALADMLTEFRLAMGQWREISMSRLRAMGLRGLSEQEYAAVLKLVAESVAHETVQEARIQVESRRDTWWSRTSVRVAVIAAVAGVLLSSIGTLVAVATLVLRHP